MPRRRAPAIHTLDMRHRHAGLEMVGGYSLACSSSPKRRRRIPWSFGCLSRPAGQNGALGVECWIRGIGSGEHAARSRGAVEDGRPT